jgi:hypothetical protein
MFKHLGSGQTPEAKTDYKTMALFFGIFSLSSQNCKLLNLYSVRKRPVVRHFIYKNDHFTKTGSGQT